MQQDPILLIGGSGTVGRTAASWFRKRNPTKPLLIGGRNLAAAQAVAEDVGSADALVVDVQRQRLAFAELPSVAGVVMLAPDPALWGMAFAQDRGVPYLSISTGLPEIGLEMAHVAHQRDAATVILSSHWSAGAATFLALHATADFNDVESLNIGVVLDPEDPAGPAAVDDMERLQDSGAAALVIKDGRRVLLSGDSSTRRMTSIDGRSLTATAYSPFDIISLHAATKAPNIRLDIATEPSSSRRRQGPASAEILVDAVGNKKGVPARVRATLEFPKGQASLTGFITALTLSAALGHERSEPARAGMYLPELLLAPDEVVNQLRAVGGSIVVTPQPIEKT